MDSVIIIPTHNPGRELVSYVEELISACVPHVLVVNDGSDAEYSQIFEEISMLPGVTLLSQAVKDRESAMALAIDYYEAHLRPLGVSGVRTVLFENEEQAERVPGSPPHKRSPGLNEGLPHRRKAALPANDIWKQCRRREQIRFPVRQPFFILHRAIPRLQS